MSDKLLGTIVGYKDNNPHRPIWSAAKELKVRLVSWERIEKQLNEKLPPLEEGARYCIKSGNGIIQVPHEDNPEVLIAALIDTECCGLESETKNMLLEGEAVNATMLCGVGVFVQKPNSIPMFPKYYFDFDMDDLIYTGEEKELWEFMEDRYLYNPRIESNMREIIKLSKGIRNKKR